MTILLAYFYSNKDRVQYKVRQVDINCLKDPKM